MRVLIGIEIKNREFISKLLLASELLKYFEIIIGASQEVFYNLKVLNPDILILNNADKNEFISKSISYLKSQNSKIILLENEGGILTELEELQKRLDKSITKSVDLYLAWSEATALFVKKKKIFEPNKIKVVGHMNFDLMKPKFQFIHEHEKNLINNKLGKYFLFNTNFSGVNEPIKGMYSSSSEAEFLIFSEELKLKMVNLIYKVAASFETKKVVVRPHPSENMEYYLELFKDYKNIVVERKGAVQAWLYGAEALIHNSCTTGLENYIGNLKTITFKPVQNPKYDMDVPNSLGIICKEEDEVISLLRKNNFEKIELDKKLKDQYPANIDHSNFSYQLISDYIRDSCNLGSSRRKMKWRFLFNEKSLKECLKPYLFRSPFKFILSTKRLDDLNYQESKMPLTPVSEVMKTLNYFTKDYSIKRVYPFKRVWMIKK